MSKPTITIEDIIAYHEAQALKCREIAEEWAVAMYKRRWSLLMAQAAAHREAAALLRKGLDE